MSKYDYIVVGAGAAGLSLVMHLIDAGKFNNKKILLVDKSPKTTNDRTWCFWEQSPGLFESLVYKRWNAMWFHGVDGTSKLHDTAPYQYKMIRGIDFYNYCFEQIGRQTNIDIRYGLIEDIFSDGLESCVVLDGEKISASVIFSSLPSFAGNSSTEYFLWQHFKGWVIETQSELFNPHEATLMDFRINQHSDTRFVYVMPFSKRQALVEYTVFSETRLKEEEYNEHLKNYCESVLGISSDGYTIMEEEFGMIPMTNRAFPSSRHNIIFIGSAGGQTKASSGYTFRFIQKHSRHIVDELVKSKSPHNANTSKKFNFYDSILLRILSEKTLSGARIFTTLFENNDIQKVFKFLDNETSVTEDIKLIRTLPKVKFLSAAIGHLLQ